MTAVTTVSGGIAFGAYDVAIAGGVEHMGHHPMGEGVDPNPRFVSEKLVDPSALVMGMTAENLHDRFPQLTQERADAFAAASQAKLAKAYADGKIEPDLVRPLTRSADERLGTGHEGRAAAARHHRRGARRAEDAVPPARPGHRRQRRRAQRRRDGLHPGQRRGGRGARPAGEDAPGRLRLRRGRPGRRWASARSRRPRRPCAPPGCPSTTSACSSSTRRSPCRCWPSSTTSASPTTTRG